MLRLDHLAVTAATLAEGEAAVAALLGVPAAGGGAHPAMATHNRLWGLGDLYLEVIAPDPGAARPGRPRWFRLDERQGPPRLTNWVAATGDLEAALAAAPPGLGVPMALARGDFRWRMAVPPDGRLPFDDTAPALIEWQGVAHPAARLSDAGLRLVRLTVTHPAAATLAGWLRPRLPDPRLAIVAGPPGLAAEIATPAGPRRLA
jgi:hypothetical protein